MWWEYSALSISCGITTPNNSQKTSHSSLGRARYGVFLWGHSLNKILTVVLWTMSYDIRPRYTESLKYTFYFVLPQTNSSVRGFIVTETPGKFQAISCLFYYHFWIGHLFIIVPVLFWYIAKMPNKTSILWITLRGQQSRTCHRTGAKGNTNFTYVNGVTPRWACHEFIHNSGAAPVRLLMTSPTTAEVPHWAISLCEVPASNRETDWLTQPLSSIIIYSLQHGSIIDITFRKIVFTHLCFSWAVVWGRRWVKGIEDNLSSKLYRHIYIHRPLKVWHHLEHRRHAGVLIPTLEYLLSMIIINWDYSLIMSS